MCPRALSLCLLLSYFTASDACGGFFCSLNQPVDQSAERLLFALEDDPDSDAQLVSMYVQIAYQGPSEKFSWVLPMPIQPLSLDVTLDSVFTELHRNTDPTFVLNWQDVDGCERPYCGPMREMVMMADAAGGGGAEDDSGVEVLQEGNVGPFKFAIIQATSTNDDATEKVVKWLNDNNYDQPPTARDLLEKYVQMKFMFVALQLQKDKTAGDIQPLIVKYYLHTEALACVPLELTSIAAVDNLPVAVWIAGPARAYSVNYFDVLVNEKKYNWLNCAADSNGGPMFGNFFGGGTLSTCQQEYLDLVSAAMDKAGGRAFVTDYAQPSSDLKTKIWDDSKWDKAELAGKTTASDSERYLLALFGNNRGDPTIQKVFRLVIPSPTTLTAAELAALPEKCRTEQGFYATWNIDDCISHYTNWQFDPQKFADYVERMLVQPMQHAQSLIDQSAVVTRLFTTMSPAEMTKDPLFAFNQELPMVPRTYEAKATPVCDDQSDRASKVRLEFADGTTREATLNNPGDCYDFVDLYSDEPPHVAINAIPSKTSAPTAVAEADLASTEATQQEKAMAMMGNTVDVPTVEKTQLPEDEQPEWPTLFSTSPSGQAIKDSAAVQIVSVWLVVAAIGAVISLLL